MSLEQRDIVVSTRELTGSDLDKLIRKLTFGHYGFSTKVHLVETIDVNSPNEQPKVIRARLDGDNLFGRIVRLKKTSV